MSAQSQALLVGGRRTPVGKYGGALSSVRPDDLAALTIKAVIEDAGIDPSVVDDVILGNANGAGEENRNVARMAWLLAGFPDTVPGITVNRLCASGMSAIGIATAMVRSGMADVVVAGGVESMSRAPWVMEKPTTAFAKPGAAFDTAIGWRFVNPRFADGEFGEKFTFSMPETAEEVGEVDGITRENADAFAARSHERALAAIEAGRFADEIVPVVVTGRKGAETIVDTDEGPVPAPPRGARRPAPDHQEGRRGHRRQLLLLNDGASAILVVSERAAQKYGLTPRARVVEFTSAGLAPEIMGLGPVPATEKALARSGWSVADLGAVELNEAFATQSLASMRRLGLDPETVNADGGAIALGHPLGSSGSRLVVTLLGRMEREGADRAWPRCAWAWARAPRCSSRGSEQMTDFSHFSALHVEEREDRVHARMDRPGVRNAIDQTMVDEFHELCAHLEREPKILIISGTQVESKCEPGTFSGIFASGADIGQLRERRRDDALRGVNSQVFDRIHRLPMPVIAAIDGFALGGGAELAYAADFRIATPALKMGQPETSLGITAAAGAQWRLKELVGEPVALELLLAGRILDAQEALELKLVTELHEPEALLDAADALADRIAQQDPLAVRLSKRVFHLPREAHPHVDEIAQAILFESEAKFERMQAFLDRKKK